MYEDQPVKTQHFLGEITGMDRAYGKLRDGLTEMGVRDNTILWYCSDNGALPKIGSTGGHRGAKGQVYEGGLLVPAILEWPAVVKDHRATNVRCNTCDIYPTLLEITNATVQEQTPLDGISLLKLIRGEAFQRDKPMGFWDYTTKGIGTPSDQWMEELYKAQQAGGDLPPHESSLNASKLPSPAFSSTDFPGHSAIVDGDWKLHRVERKGGDVKFELYDLNSDRVEAHDIAAESSEIVNHLKPKLRSWLTSVTQSINGEDY